MAVLRFVILAASFLNAVAFIFTHKQVKEIVVEALEEQKSKQSLLQQWLPVLLPSSAFAGALAWVRRDLLD